MSHRLRHVQSAILTVGIAVWAFACNRSAPMGQTDIKITVVKGNNQTTPPGRKFPDDITIQVKSLGGSPIPGMTVLLEPVDPVEGSSLLVYSVLSTDASGTVRTKAVGGMKPNFTSKFMARSMDGAAKTFVTLATGDAVDGGEGEEDKGPKGEGGADMAGYLLVTSHKNVETAGVPFTVTVYAVDKDKRVVETFVGERTFAFQATQANAATPTTVAGDLAPSLPGPTKLKFAQGRATVPATPFVIRKILDNMILTAQDDAKLKGESEILDLRPGPLARLEIASGETKGDVIKEGMPITGERFEMQGPVPVYVPSTTPLEKRDYPPFPLTTGVSLALQALGYDAYGNRFRDPVPSTWTAFDVGATVSTLPSPPVFPTSLALRGYATGMNLLVPTKDGLGYIRAVHTETVGGVTKTFEAKTGTLVVTSDRPTTLVATLFEDDGSGVVNPAAPVITKPQAGKAYWVRLEAASSLGMVATGFNGTGTVRVVTSAVKRSRGWPLPEDASPSDPTLNAWVPRLDGQNLVDESGGIVTPQEQSVPVAYHGGVAWLRAWNGAAAAIPDVDARPPAKLAFFNVGDEPVLQWRDDDNGIYGVKTLGPVQVGAKAHLKLAFNDSLPVLTGLEAMYPDGVDVGTKLRDWRVEVGRSLVLATFGFDAWGNPLGLAPAYWTPVGMPSFYLAYATDPVKINLLKPDDLLASPGRIRVVDAADPAIWDESGAIATLPGLPNRFEVKPLVANVKAGSKFAFQIRAVDKAGNTAVTFDTSAPGAGGIDVKQDVLVEITGAAKTPAAAWFPGTPAYNAYNALMAEYGTSPGKTLSLEFVNGVASVPAGDPAALMFFFSDETPVIKVRTPDNAVVGFSQPIAVQPEALHHLKAHFVGDVTVDDNGTLHTYAADSVVGNAIITAGDVFKLLANGYDRYDNRIGPVNVDWDNSDADDLPATPNIAAPDYNGTLANFAITHNSSFTIYTANKSGKAFLKMTAPASLCTAGTLACEPAGGPVLSYSGVVEAKVGRPIAVRVVPVDPANPSHVAGVGFDMKVQVLDVNGQVALSYNNKNLNLTAITVQHTPGEASSVSGVPAEQPAPQTLTMLGGEAVLTGFKVYNIYDRPTVNVAATLPDGTVLSNVDGMSVAQTFVPGPKSQIRVIDAPQVDGAINRGAYHRPYVYNGTTNRLVLTPSAERDLYAGAFDQYLNWVGDVSATWSTPASCPVTGPNAYAGKTSGTNPANKIHLNQAGTTGDACVSISSDAGAYAYDLTNIKIESGTPKKIRLTIYDGNGKTVTQNLAGGSADVQPGFQLVADEVFQFGIELVDEANAVVPSVNQDLPFTITLAGASASDTCPDHPTPRNPAWFPDGGSAWNDVTGPLTATLPITAGAVTKSKVGQFRVPRAGTPFTIKVDATIDMDGAGPDPAIVLNAGVVSGLTAAPNVLDRVNFRTAALGQGTMVQGATRSITTDDGLNLFAAGYDRVCNYTGDVASTWTATGVALDKLVGDTAAGSSVFVRPDANGSATVKAKANSLVDPTCAKCGDITLNVAAGTVHALKVTTQHNGNERAGVPFTFTVQAVDKFGNRVDAFAGGKALTFVWDALVGPNGTYSPAKPADGTSYTFTTGDLDAANFSDASKKLTLARAGQTVLLRVRHDLGAKTVEGQAAINVTTGPVTSLKTYDLTGAETEVVGTPKLEVDATPIFAVKGFDVAGNGFGNMSATWTATGTLAPAASHFDKTTGNFIVVTPSTLGAATVTGSFNRAGDPDAADATLTSTITVDVIPGRAKKFLVMTEKTWQERYNAGLPNQKETAGVPFGIRVVAVDNKGAVDVGFDKTNAARGIDYGNLTFGVAMLEYDAAWPTQPVGPTTLTAPVFVAGVATIPAGSGFTFFKAKDTPRLQVTLTTAVPHVAITSANSGPIAFAPNATHSLRVITLNAGGDQTVMPRDGDMATIPDLKTGDQRQFYAIGHDQWGNYTEPLTANWSGTDQSANRLVPATGESSYLAPLAVGKGRVVATAVTSLPGDQAYATKEITFTAAAAAGFAVEPLFIDQDANAPGVQAVTAASFAQLDALRVFASETDVNVRHQRVMQAFGLRLKALDANGNLSPTYCNGHQTPLSTPQVCDVKISFPLPPHNGPDGSAPAPSEGSILKVRWINGYGIFVADDGSFGTPIFPFSMKKANETITIKVTAVTGGAASGTTDAIPVKNGPLDHLLIRNLANDTGPAGFVYSDPYNDMQEGQSYDMVASGFDAAKNYIQDITGDWTRTGSAVTFATTPTATHKVSVTALTSGASTVTVSTPPGPDYPAASKAVTLNVQSSPPTSYRVWVVEDGVWEADGVTPKKKLFDANGDGTADEYGVKAGEPFKILVEAMTGGPTKVRATGYNGPKALFFSSDDPLASDLNMQWTKPTPDSAPNYYTFASGVAVLQGVKLAHVPAAAFGKTKLVITNVDASLSGSVDVHNRLGDPGFARIRRGPAKTDAEVAALDSFALNAGVPLHAHVYDLGGNWLHTHAATWTWRGQKPATALGPLPGFVDPGDASAYLATVPNQASVTFKPQDIVQTNTGEMGVTLTDGGFAVSHAVAQLNVYGNTADHFTVTAENAGNWVATSCYKITVAAKDAGNNPAPYYTGGKDLAFILTLDDGTTPYPTLIGGIENPTSKAIARPDDGTYVFDNGTFTTANGAFCLRDATGLPSNRVKITVKDANATSIAGSTLVNVAAGAPSQYGLYPAQTEAMPLCGPVSVVAGDTKDYWLHELDAVGNFIRRMDPVTWAGQASLNGVGIVGAAANGGVRLLFKKSGNGSLSFDIGGGAQTNLSCSPYFVVKPGLAKKLTIANEHGPAGETATTPFSATVQLLDQFNNVVDDINGDLPLRIATNSPNAPYGKKPKIAGAADATENSFTATFTAGVHQSAAAAFLLPAAGAFNLTVEATSIPAPLASRIDAGGLALGLAAGIVVKPGSAAGIQIRANHDPLASLIDDAWAASPANEILTVGTTNFFACTADTYGNYVGKASDVTWSLLGLPNTLSPNPTDKSLAVYGPLATGSGKVRITSNASTGPLVGASWDSATLTVKSAAASKWRVTLINGGAPATTVPAGTKSDIRIEAVDESGVVDETFDRADLAVTLQIQGASPAPVPFHTQYVPTFKCDPATPGDCTAAHRFNASPMVETLTFVHGVAVIPNLVLYNTQDVVRVSVTGGGFASPAGDGVLNNVRVARAPFARPFVRYDAGFGDDPKTIITDQVLYMNLIGIDLYGNSFGPLAADVGIKAGFGGITDYDGYTGAIDVDDKFTGTVTPTSITPTFTTAIFTPVKVGRGFFEFTCADALCLANNGGNPIIVTTAEVTVDPGLKHHFTVEVENDTEVFHHGSAPFSPAKFQTEYQKKASVPFHVRVTAVDAKGNTVKSFTNAAPLVITLDLDNNVATNDSAGLVSPAPAASTPQVPSNASNWTFINGVWSSRLKADRPFKLVKAGANPFIWVQTSDMTMSGKTPERVEVVPGAINRIRFYSEAGKAGQEIGTGVGAPATAANDRHVIGTGDPLRMYLASFDVDDNYIADEVASWTMPAAELPATILAAERPAKAYGKLDGYTAASDPAVYSNTAFKTFTPAVAGDYRLDVASATDPTVTASLWLSVTTKSATKLRAHIVYDFNGDGTYTDPGESSLYGMTQAVKAGECFSVEIRALDPDNNLDTNYNATLSLDFSTDAPVSDVGFHPIPSAAPLFMQVTFKNGIAVTPAVNSANLHGIHPLTLSDHRCAQSGKMGTFVLMKSSPTPANTYFIRISDGAETGLDDAQIDIRVDKGLTDFVALFAGGEGADVPGKIIGTSQRLASDPKADMTVPANWDTDTLKCQGAPDLYATCLFDESAADGKYRTFTAGLNPGTKYARFHVRAYDAGGNFTGAPTANWGDIRGTLGYVASNSPQYTDTPAPTAPWFEQYVVADGTYADRTGDSATISATNAIYYYPMKPMKGGAGRVVAKDITIDGKTFVIAGWTGITTMPSDYENIELRWAPDLATAEPAFFRAGTDVPITLNLRDKFNNGIWADQVTIQIGLYAVATGGGNRLPLDAVIGNVPYDSVEYFGGYSSKSYPANITRLYFARDWYMEFTVMTEGRTLQARKKLRVIPQAPYSQLILRQSSPSSTDVQNYETNPLGGAGYEVTVGTDTYWAMGLYDKYANFIQFVKHGWAEVGPADKSDKFLVNWVESPNPSDPGPRANYYDGAGNPVAPQQVAFGTKTYYVSERVRFMPRYAHYWTGQPEGSRLQLITDNIPINSARYPDLPENGSSVTINRFASFENNFANNIFATVYPGTPTRLDVRAKAVDSAKPAVGDDFFIEVLALDEYDNQANGIVGLSANINLEWQAGTVLPSADMCGLMGVSGADCVAESRAVLSSGVARKWGLAHNLADTANSFIFTGGWSALGSPEAYALSTAKFRFYNTSVVPQARACFLSRLTGSAGSWGSMDTGVCSAYMPMTLAATPDAEILVMQNPGSGIVIAGAPRWLDLNGNGLVDAGENKDGLYNYSPLIARTFATNTNFWSIYASRFDVFGNYKGLVPLGAPTWSVRNVLNPLDDSPLANGNFTGIWKRWPDGDRLEVNPLASRIPVKAETKVSYNALATDWFQLVQEDAKPGRVAVDLYTDANDANTRVTSTPTAPAGSSYYVTLRVGDQGYGQIAYNATSEVTFSGGGSSPTRANKNFDLPAKATGVYFCNGWAVTSDLSGVCTITYTPSFSQLRKWPVTMYSAMGGNANVSVAVKVPDAVPYFVNGTSRSINIQPLTHDHYTVVKEAGEPAAYYLNNALKFVLSDGTTLKPAALGVYASDVHGNDTTLVNPATESDVRLGIVSNTGNPAAGICPSGTAVGSCGSTTTIFKCKKAGDAVATNCLDVALDLSSGQAHVDGLEIDSPSINYYIHARSTNGAGKFTFDPAAAVAAKQTQIAERASYIQVNCDTSCIAKFALSYASEQQVGNPFNMTISMLDTRDRRITDPNLNIQVSGTDVIWNAGLAAATAGGAPDNVAATGFNTRYAFADGSVTFPVTVNKIWDPTPLAATTLTFTIAGIASDNGNTALYVRSGSAYRYVIKAVDPGSTAAAPINPVSSLSRNADSGGTFNLHVQAIDKGGNYVASPSSVTVEPLKVGGPYANSGSFIGTTSCSLTATVGRCVITGLTYRVGNTVQVGIQGQNMAASPDRVTIAFTPTSGTIKNLHFLSPGTIKAFNGSTPGYSGDNGTLTILDGANNPLTQDNTLKTFLQSVSFALAHNQAGYGTSTVSTGTLTWNNGVATIPLNLIKAGTLNAGNLTVTATFPDTGSTAYPASDAGRNAIPVTITPNNVNQIKICPSTAYCEPSLSNVTAKAQSATYAYYILGFDAYDNLVGQQSAGTWSTTSVVPGSMTQGGANTNHYDWSAASGGLTVKVRGVPQTSSYLDFQASLAGTTAKTLRVNFAVGDLSKTVVPSANRTSSPATLLAGNGNFNINRVELYYSVDGKDWPMVDQNGYLSIVNGGTAFVAGDGPASYSCQFANGVCADSWNLNLQKVASGTLTQSVTVGSSTQTNTITGVTVDANDAASLTASVSPASPVAGDDVTVNLTVKDAYGNLTSRNCTGGANRMSLSNPGGNDSPGGNGAGAAKAPVLNDVDAPSSTGTFASTANKVYKSGAISLNVAACGVAATSLNFTTKPAAVNQVYVTAGDYAAGYPTASSPSATCPGATTASCGAYAWAYDLYGNWVPGSGTYNWACPSWSFVNASGGAGYTLNNAALSHYASVSNATSHVDGTLTCTDTASGKTASVTIKGPRRVTPALSCAGSWTCSASGANDDYRPKATCTLNNTTGYDITALAWSSTAGGAVELDTTGCTGALTNGNNCGVTLYGTPGSSSGTISAAPTPADASKSDMTTPTASVAGGAAAPTCNTPFAQSISAAWAVTGGSSCADHTYQVTYTITNNANRSVSVTGTSVSNALPWARSGTCTTSPTLVPGGSCTLTLDTAAGQFGDTRTVSVNTSGFYTGLSFSATSPSCP